MAIANFSWDSGCAEVQSLGGMLGPVTFRLPSGREVQPFAVAPWSGDTGPEHSALPGILRRLRGEWPCVPFGAPAADVDLPLEWRGAPSNPVDSEFHGYSSSAEWQLGSSSDGGISLVAEYPNDHPITGLERRITGVPGRAALDISLTIRARRAVKTTLALHPVFHLPAERHGCAKISASFDEGMAFPKPVEPGVSRFAPGALFDRLDRVPDLSGGVVDASRLPLDFETEELLQCCGVSGPISLEFPDEGYKVIIRFDVEVFPSFLIWISNRGRRGYPWNGRFTAVGLEPVCGAFDLGPQVGAWTGNPIARRGYRTSRLMQAGEILTTNYNIEIEEA